MADRYPDNFLVKDNSGKDIVFIARDGTARSERGGPALTGQQKRDAAQKIRAAVAERNGPANMTLLLLADVLDPTFTP